MLALGAAYVAIALQRELVPAREEVFPFASWSLFSLVPNQTHDFSLRILEVDGRKLARPVYFEQAGELFDAARSNGARMCIQRLGRALQKHDQPAADEERCNVEQIHLRGHARVRYEVVARSYDAIQRFRDGRIDAQSVVATFATGEFEGAEVRRTDAEGI